MDKKIDSGSIITSRNRIFIRCVSFVLVNHQSPSGSPTRMTLIRPGTLHIRVVTMYEQAQFFDLQSAQAPLVLHGIGKPRRTIFKGDA